MTSSGHHSRLPVLGPITPEGLRRAVVWLRRVGLSVLAHALAWAVIALGIGLRAIVAIRVGRFTGGNDEIHGMDLVGVAISGVGMVLLPVAWLVSFKACLSQSDAHQVISAVPDSRWAEYVRRLSGTNPVLALLGWSQLLFLLRAGRMARFLGSLTADQKLSHLCADIRRGAWVLLAELVGLPVIGSVLAARGLDGRFIGGIFALLIGMFAYVLVQVSRATRRASAVLQEVACR